MPDFLAGRSALTRLRRMRFGRYEVTLLRAGFFRQDGGILFGTVPKVLWQKLVDSDERNRVNVPLTCLLLRDDRNVLLLETGVGDKLDERRRDIFGIDPHDTIVPALASLGVRPEDVTLVLNTHLHFDHSGGNTRRDGDGKLVPAFPRARYVLQRLEWEDALHPHERSRASYFPDDFAPLEPVVELIDGEAEVLPGVHAVGVRGHTRATQYLRVEEEGRSLFFSCDFMPTRHHLAPAWIMAMDLFPMETLAAKKELLPRAVEERWLVAFTHDEPRWGRVVERDGKYGWEPAA